MNTNTKTEELLVFDKCHYFSRFLKTAFKNINFVCIHNTVILHEKSSEFPLILFILYSEDDLIDLFRVYATGSRLLVCNHSVKMKKLLTGFSNLTVIDCLGIKYEIVENLKVVLQ
jgi:hypothetical protein